MDAHHPFIEFIAQRRSTRPRYLVAPAPTTEQLEAILQAAMAAPDHGGLRPWRFLVIEGSDRERLAELLVASLVRRHPGTDAEALERMRDKAVAKAPMMIGLVVHVDDSVEQVPEDEQRHAVAIAGGYLMLAAQAMGFGAILLSGEHVRDRWLLRQMGLADNEHLLGWINLGTPAKPLTARQPEDVAGYIRRLPVAGMPPV